MDKKILMLGLVISGNVFGMDDNRDFSEQYRSQSPENKIERKYHYDKCKLDSFSGIFSSLEGHPYGFQLRMDRVHNELAAIMKTPVNTAEKLIHPIGCLFAGYDSIKNFFNSKYYSNVYNKTFLMMFNAAVHIFNELELNYNEQMIVDVYKEKLRLLNEDNLVDLTSRDDFICMLRELSYITSKRMIWE